MGVKVLQRLNRNFKPYAVCLNITGVYACVDGSYEIWVSKKDALKVAADIKSKLEDKVSGANNE